MPEIKLDPQQRLRAEYLADDMEWSHDLLKYAYEIIWLRDFFELITRRKINRDGE